MKIRIVIALIALTTLTLLGTLGYVLVERAGWIESLYMTVITLSTVGFDEAFPLSPAGRLFTIGLIVCGGGTAAYLAASVLQLFTADVVTRILGGRSMQKRIDGLSQHVIVCGYGRFGQVLIAELARSAVPVVVVERNPERQLQLERSGALFLIRDATADESLERAGIGRARAIAAVTSSDPNNVFITLAARERRADLRIHARGETAEAVRRLKQAGADYVLSAYRMGGLSLATSILRPSVVRFLELLQPHGGREVDIEEIRVEAGCALCGQSLRAVETQHPRCRIVALMRLEQTELVPAPEQRIAPGDLVVAIGERSSLEALATQATQA